MNDIERAIERIMRYKKCNSFSIETENCDKAIESLIKQIPKKPTLKPIPYCPHCNKVFITRNQDYCHRCGGKIDWSEVENE